MKLNSQTRIIVATAAALAVVDIAVRVSMLGHANAVGTANGVVTAQGFRLVDQWGNERATINLDANGEPGIKLFDRFGTERAQIDTFENTPSVIFMDKNGQRRSYYGMDNDTGNSIVEMYNADEQPLANLSTQADDAHLSLTDNNGNSQSVSSGQTISYSVTGNSSN